ncbi:MAG: carboxylate--amine ligase [Elusimicrobia bacterium]|nr:carboxylate--amine ligase [Elusimicrobiota bacterium]
MNFIFLSPSFPPNYYRFCANLKGEGANVLGIGEAPFQELRPELRESLAWYYQVSDMHDYGQLAEAMRFFTARFGKIDRLDSLNEYWLKTEARLRTEFAVAGVQASDVAEIRHKSLMKKIFAQTGIPHARGIVVSDAGQARELAAAWNFPVIVKPDDGMGAELTYRLDSPSDVDRFFANKPDRNFILEEFIRGDIVTFDGLAGPAGEIIFCASHVYGEGVMESVLADSHISYYSLREIPGDLEDAGRKLLKNFRVKERFFHFEFFRRQDGTLCALEVNIRPPGGMTVDMFNFACDINMYGIWAKMMAHGTDRLQYGRKYHCAYISRKNRFKYRRSHEEILTRLGSLLAHHEELPPVLARAMGDYGYIIRSRYPAVISDAVKFIQELK